MMHIKKIWFVFLSSTVLNDVHAATPLAEGLEYAISEMEKSLSPSMKRVFLDAIDKVVRVKNEEVATLEGEIQALTEALESSHGWTERLAGALTLCRAQSSGKGTPRQKDGGPQGSASLNAYREYLLKRLKQTSNSYLDLKLKFRDAVALLETQFPGFKYRAKGADGVREQLENWKRSQGK